MNRTHVLGVAVLLGFGLMAVALITDLTPRALWLVFADDAPAPRASDTPIPAPTPPAAPADALRIAALGDADPDVAKAAVYALGESLSDDELGILGELARRAGHVEVRKAAVYALGHHEAAVPYLAALATEDGHVEVRKAAVHALSNVGTPAARDALIALLHTGDALGL